MKIHICKSGGEWKHWRVKKIVKVVRWGKCMWVWEQGIKLNWSGRAKQKKEQL